MSAIVPLDVLASDLPPALVDVVMRSLIREVDSRVGSTRELEVELERIS